MTTASTMSPSETSPGVEMKPKAAATFLSLLVPSGLFFAIIWSWLAPNRFYHCADPIPIQSFIPPFLHNHDGKYMDTFIASEIAVYAVWLTFVILALVLPVIASLAIVRAAPSVSTGGGKFNAPSHHAHRRCDPMRCRKGSNLFSNRNPKSGLEIRFFVL